MTSVRAYLIIYVTLFSLFLISCQSKADGQQNGKVDIDFTVHGIPAGTVKFIGNVGDVRYLLDSVNIEADESFSLEMDSLVPSGYYIALLPGQKTIQFLLDKDQKASFEANYSNIPGTIEVSGSVNNTLLWENLAFEQAFNQERQRIRAQLQTLEEGSPEFEQVKNRLKEMVNERQAHIEQFKEEHPNTFFTHFKLAGQFPELKEPKKPDGTIDEAKQTRIFREEYWDNVDFSDERLLRTPVIHNKLKNYVETYLPKNPDTLIKYLDPVLEKSLSNDEMFKFVANWLAIKFHKSDIMGGEKVFVHVVDNYFTDERAWWATNEDLKDIRREANLFRPSFIGNKGKNLKAIDPQGNIREIYELDNPYVIVYFWSFDCEHCQEQTPELREVSKQYGDKLGVYAFSLHPDKDPWLDAIKRYGIQEWVNVYDPDGESKHYQKYHVDITPEIYLLDPDRIIIGKDLKPHQVPTVLERDMKKRGMM